MVSQDNNFLFFFWMRIYHEFLESDEEPTENFPSFNEFTEPSDKTAKRTRYWLSNPEMEAHDWAELHQPDVPSKEDLDFVAEDEHPLPNDNDFMELENEEDEQDAYSDEPSSDESSSDEAENDNDGDLVRTNARQEAESTCAEALDSTELHSRQLVSDDDRKLNSTPNMESNSSGNSHSLLPEKPLNDNGEVPRNFNNAVDEPTTQDDGRHSEIVQQHASNDNMHCSPCLSPMNDSVDHRELTSKRSPPPSPYTSRKVHKRVRFSPSAFKRAKVRDHKRSSKLLKKGKIGHIMN